MTTATINQNMTVREIMTLVPAAADIMIEYGLHCFSCSVGGVETLAEGCQMHGFDTDTVEALVEDINCALGQAPKRPQELTITADAARGIHKIASAEGNDGQILVVTLDEQGAFCLEFQEKPLLGDMEFTNPDVAEVRIFASVLTLSRIGGATIDVREGRFKLDMPEEGGCCKGTEESCGCTEDHS
jgi:hybrid cluster-associated redox disulfide protein